jgi:hypothetical protein
MFLWGIGGIGLIVFAVDDYFTLHENLGDALYSQFTFLPVFTATADDMLVLVYAITGVVALYVFRMELMARRNSTTLLYLAAVASVVMVVTDVTPLPLALKAPELPAQTLAVSLLMCAFVLRYVEVRAGVRARVHAREREAVA